MKKIRTANLQGLIRSTLLGGFGAWALGLILQRLLGVQNGALGLLGALGAVGGLLGAIFARREKWGYGVLMFLVAAGFSVALQRQDCGVVYVFAAAVLTFVGAAAGGHGFYPPMGIVPVLLLILGSVISEGTLQIAAGIGGLFCLVLLLDGCRERSIRKGQHLGQKSPIRGQQNIKINSIVLTALFFLGALAVSAGIYLLLMLLGRLLSVLFAYLAEEAGAAYGQLEVLVNRFNEWFWSLFHWEGPERGTRIEVSGNGKPLPKLVVAGSLALMVALITGGGTLALALAAFVGYRHRKPKRFTETAEDYVDEVEWLERPGFRGLFKGRFRSTGNYQGAMAVRHAFQTLLRRRQRAGETVFSRTPNELRRQDAAENAIIASYNRVRYGGIEPTTEEVALAKKYVKK